MIRTDLGAPDPDEDPVTYNTDAVEAQGQGPNTTPWGPRETHGAVAEHNGGSYHLKHLRSAPQQEVGSSTSQGRLFRPAVPYDDLTHDQIAHHAIPGQNDVVQGQFPSYLSDDVARAMRVDPGRHPVNYGRGRTGASDESYAPSGNATRNDPEAPNRATAGRLIHGGLHRRDEFHR